MLRWSGSSWIEVKVKLGHEGGVRRTVTIGMSGLGVKVCGMWVGFRWRCKVWLSQSRMESK